MRQLLDIARRLVHDERGVFLPLFGILAIVLIATSGAVVDYTTVEQARSRAQVALDAAALALQPRIYTDSNDVLKGKAQALLVERLGDPSITANVLTATKDTTEGSLRFTAQLTVPMAFVSLVGIKTMSAGLLSEATRKMLNLEVVMVLDNSNSMSNYSRMTHLRSAANCLANILYNDNCTSTATTASNDRTWIGIVPFTMQVNVGTGKCQRIVDGSHRRQRLTSGAQRPPQQHHQRQFRQRRQRHDAVFGHDRPHRADEPADQRELGRVRRGADQPS